MSVAHGGLWPGDSLKEHPAGNIILLRSWRSHGVATDWVCKGWGPNYACAEAHLDEIFPSYVAVRAQVATATRDKTRASGKHESVSGKSTNSVTRERQKIRATKGFDKEGCDESVWAIGILGHLFPEHPHSLVESYPRRVLEQQYLHGRFRISEKRISKLLDVDIKSHDLLARYLHLPANADRARAEAKRVGVDFEDWGQVIYEIGCAEFVAQGEAFGSYGIHEHPITRRQLFVEQFPGKLTELATALAASPHMTTFLASQELGSGVQLVIDHTAVAGLVGCSVSDWINDWRHCALRAAILKAIEIVRASTPAANSVRTAGQSWHSLTYEWKLPPTRPTARKTIAVTRGRSRSL